jgi:hypothetical protein
LDASASCVAGGGHPIGCARLKKSHFIIKYFLNSNSAGANYNSATTVACAVYSVGVEEKKTVEMSPFPIITLHIL